MLFDTHAHYDDKAFDADRDELLLSMAQNGVGTIINCGADMKGCRASVKLAQKYDFIYAAVGLHPYDAQNMTEADLEMVRSLSHENKVVAIGEIGLDYHYDDCDREKQKFWFSRQMELAREENLPFVVHERNAKRDCLDLLAKYKGHPFLMHCFSGSVEIAREVLSMGAYLSFGGTLTFKNNVKTVEVAKMVPPDRFVLETDCPYLSPVPHRGERNSSKNMYLVAEKMAQLKGLPFDEVVRLSEENARRFFNI